MIDIHTHILPEMDDGSKSVEQSVEMLKVMQNEGVATVVATPHFDMRKENIDSFLQRRRTAAERLQEAATAEGILLPRLALGAEVLYCGVGLSRIEGIEQLCLGKGRCLLVETQTIEWEDSFEEDLECLMLEQNITPILAHAERYLAKKKNRDIFYRLCEKGMLVQSNAEFFIRRRTHRLSKRLLRDKTIQVLGSDCHNLDARKPNLPEAAAVIRRRLGEETLQSLIKNARDILKLEALPSEIEI